MSRWCRRSSASPANGPELQEGGGLTGRPLTSTPSLPDVIVINGASSTGKTSIARELQEALAAIYLNFSIDSVLYALPPSDLARMIAGESITRGEYDYEKLVRGHHAAAAALLASGNRLIMDNAITRPSWREDLTSRLAPFAALWVGVQCELGTLRRRELARGDRAPGTAEREAAVVHHGFDYDLMVDTSCASPAQAADAILRWMRERPTGQAGQKVAPADLPGD